MSISFRIRNKLKNEWVCIGTGVLNILTLDLNSIETTTYIGRNDVKDFKICEGDIVQFIARPDYSSSAYIGEMKYNKKLCCFQVIENNGEIHDIQSYGFYTILGNKYDGPSLSEDQIKKISENIFEF